MVVVLGNREAIARCIKESNAGHGSISMTWTINANGKTSDVRCTTEDFKGTPLAECLTAAIKAWTFPPFSGPPQTVPFPFKF